MSSKIDWYNVSIKGLVTSKLLLIVFVLVLVSVITTAELDWPFNGIGVAIEICLAAMIFFTVIQLSTFRPFTAYDFERLKTEKEPVKLLITKVAEEIAHYESGASYFFKSVKFYKYTTIILAGISTITLGIDPNTFGENWNVAGIEYAVFAKNVALVIGTYITVSTSLMSYWQIEKYWLTNKTIANKLRALRDDIENDFVSAKLSADLKLLDQRISEYRAIKSDFYKHWEGALAERSTDNKSI